MNALTGTQSFFFNSLIYKEFLEEKQEVLKHKWIESEKKGYDIGFDTALIEWIVKYRSGWRNSRYKNN